MDFRNRHTLLGISALLLYLVQITWGGSATLVNNAYANVVVGISQDNAADGSLPGTITDLLKKTSEVLYTATGNRTYFGNVIIAGTNAFVKSNPRSKRSTSNQWQPPVPTFQSADIRIDVANAAYGDVPYTQQSRGCGEPGDFIHLTPAFLRGRDTDATTKAKLLANEWIKYRYGVFDETGYDWDELYPVQYYGADGQTEYNMCNNNTDISWATDNCNDDSNIQGLSKQCTLKPDMTPGANSNVNSSMMSQPIVQLATKYCTDSSDHNSDAPNKQNFLCDGKSIMEVVLQHPDFASGQNPPKNADFASLPTLVVTTSIINDKIGLIIVSDRLAPDETSYVIKPSLKKFVMLDFPPKSFLGLYQNVDGSVPSAPHTPAIDYEELVNRAEASNKIQLLVDNTNTIAPQNIVDTVTTVIGVLNAQSTPPLNKAILLISDQLSQNDLNNICPKANSSGIQLHLVTFDNTMFTTFNNFGQCPGQVYFIQAQAQPTLTNNETACYADMQRRAQLENTLMNLPSTISPSVFERPTVMYTNTVTNGTFFVDEQVTGGETAFIVETCLNGVYGVQPADSTQLLHCTISTQDNLLYNESVAAIIDATAINASGSYTFTVQNQKPKSGPVPFVVNVARSPFITSSSSGTSNGQMLKTEAWALFEEMGSWTKVRIFASVKNGTTPIFDASVTTTIISSLGPVNKNYTVILVDDGSGNPDITVRDGIYSAYFTQMTSTSAPYSAAVTITDNDGAANYPTNTYPWISEVNDMSLVNTPSFRRTVQTNVFTAKGQSGDIPPGRVTNLRVSYVDGSDISLTWTAPGDDLDYGTANRYAFNCHTDKTYLQTLTKLDDPTADIDSNLPANDIQPQAAGETEKTTFTGHFDQTVHYCAVQAVDKNSKYGSMSNIVSYYVTTESTGLSSASIAGIVVGVILCIILIIAIIVLIWYCMAKRDEVQDTKPRQEDTEGQEESKLKPIIVQNPIAVDQRSNIYAVDALQNISAPNSRPASMHSLAHSNRSGYDGNGSDDDDARSNYSKHTAGLQTFQKGIPAGIPVLPTESYQMQPFGGNHYGNQGLHDPGEQFDSTYLMANADVAVPQRLAKLATIEDVGEYHDKNILKGTPGSREDIDEYRNMPVYNHILNKQQAPPLPPPRSASSSQSSLSNIGKPISQV